MALLAAALDTAPARALEGFRCTSSSQCDHVEVCVAASAESTWGTCRRMKILP
jgi:hypothetical protein